MDSSSSSRLLHSEVGELLLPASRPTYIALAAVSPSTGSPSRPATTTTSLLLALPTRRLSAVSGTSTVIVDRQEPEAAAEAVRRPQSLYPTARRLSSPSLLATAQLPSIGTQLARPWRGQRLHSRRQSLDTAATVFVRRPSPLTADLGFLMTPPYSSSSSIFSSPSSSSSSPSFNNPSSERVGGGMCRHCGGRNRRRLKQKTASQWPQRLRPITFTYSERCPLPRRLSCSCGLLPLGPVASGGSPSLYQTVAGVRVELGRSVSTPGLTATFV